MKTPEVTLAWHRIYNWNIYIIKQYTGQRCLNTFSVRLSNVGARGFQHLRAEQLKALAPVVWSQKEEVIRRPTGGPKGAGGDLLLEEVG